MAHPNLYKDNIVDTKHTSQGTHIHISHPVFGDAIIRTHDAEGKILPGEENTSNPRRDVVATGQTKHIQNKFKQLGAEIKMPTKNEEYEEISSMLESILAGELTESKDTFASILSSKIAQKLEEAKIKVAQSLFGESKASDAYTAGDVFDKHAKKAPEKQEKSEEVDDDSFSKSLHGKLKTAEDIDDNPVEEHEKENPNDKRVIAGLKARAAKGETSVPNAHRNIDLKSGSVTLKHGDAKQINSFLGGLKPEKRLEVMGHMQKSPEHFGKIHDVIKKFPAPKDNTSIYSADPRT
jgi:hypothetical protein